MTCERCAEFEEEIAYLKSELGLVYKSSREADIAKITGASPQLIKFMRVLYAAKGRTLSNFQIEDRLPATDNIERASKLVPVYVCKLRKIIGKNSISNNWGRGYYLTPTGLRVVQALLNDA